MKTSLLLTAFATIIIFQIVLLLEIKGGNESEEVEENQAAHARTEMAL